MPRRRIAVTTLVLAVLAPIGSAASAAPSSPSLSAVSFSATSEPTFAPAQAISVGPFPEATAIGDVTGDGRADVLLGMLVDADPSDVYDLLVFAQQADGSLASPVRYQTGLSSGDRAGMGVAVLDANGDGRRDVALATRAGVQLLTQTTEGKLAIGGLLAGTVGAEHIAAADMDRDGDADLVVNGEAGTALLRQGPAGVFVLSVVAPEWVYAMAVGDVDSDGWPDIAVCGRVPDVLVYHRSTTTGWTRTAHTPIEDYWGVHEGLEIADVTGDGRADVAVTDSGNSPAALLNVFRQTATGTLAAPVVYHTPDIPQPVKAADLNGDGRNDLVIGHGGWLQVSVLLQGPDGTLASPVSYPVPYGSYNSQGLALGDINGDKQVDAVLADRSNNLVVLRNIYRAGTALSGATSATAVTYGAMLTVSGRLTRADTGASIAGAPVQLYGRRKGATSWVLLGTATSTSTGTVALSHRPSWSLDYRWTYQGSSMYLGGTSSLRAVGVRPSVTATLSRTSVALGGSVSLSGTVAPNHAGQVVYLQRLVNGSWSTVASRTLSSTSTYAFTLKPSYRGTYYYRVYKPADTDHLAGYSSTRSFKVY